MNYGFLIDNRKCIGCHACSVACKAENQVPIGSHRTWVKYVEKGLFPDVRRTFTVTRCNHCANPPCVTICPVTALSQRPDGIVDLDGDACIGCKSCLQACPYDALYIHPDTGTAQKCHFCAHRVERQLEPPCVVVCPERAIVAGDLDDSTSEIARLVAREPVSVRKPEQGTRPKLYYIDGDSAALTPLAAPPEPSYMWTTPLHASPYHQPQGGNGRGAGRGPVPAEPPRARPVAGHGRAMPDLAPPLAALLEPSTAAALGLPVVRSVLKRRRLRRVHDVGHARPWGMGVSAYIFTKGIAAGTFLVGALLALLDLLPRSGAPLEVSAVLALVFLGITGALLVHDLERPERFLRVLFRPQWRSWLVLGAYIITAFAAVTTGWLLFSRLGLPGPRDALLVLSIPLSALTAIYTAFLFGQAEGRDFWQSPALAPALLVHSTASGAAVLLLAGLVLPSLGAATPALLWVLGGSLAAHLIIVLAGEVLGRHASAEAAAAAHLLRSGPLALPFWGGAVGAGHLLPLALLGFAPTSVPAFATAAVLASLGLLLWGHLFVEAGQAVPIS